MFSRRNGPIPDRRPFDGAQGERLLFCCAWPMGLTYTIGIPIYALANPEFETILAPNFLARDGSQEGYQQALEEYDAT